MKIICEYCEQELMEQGGLLFDPPNKRGMCKKHHLCKICYSKCWVSDYLNNDL